MTHYDQQTCGVRAVLQGEERIARSSLQLFSMEGRVCAVTGGHRGLGLEIAFAYAEAGAIVYCIDLPPRPNENFCKVQQCLADQPHGHGQGHQGIGRVEYMCCDVTKQKDIWAAMEKIAEKEGRLNVCVACAGILGGAEVLEYPADEFQKIMETNVNGLLFSAQGAGRMMVKYNIPGSIILMGSISGHAANKGMHWTAYNASKAAVLQMARSMACELCCKNIRCNSISPGYVYTDMAKPFLDANPKLKEM